MTWPRVRGRLRAERARQHAEVQAGLWRGASPVRTLADMTPEERARVIAKIEAAHARCAKRSVPRERPRTEPKSARPPQPRRLCSGSARKGRPLSTDGSTIREQIEAQLRSGPKTVAELVAATGLPARTLSNYACHLIWRGRLRRVRQGVYALARVE